MLIFSTINKFITTIYFINAKFLPNNFVRKRNPLRNAPTLRELSSHTEGSSRTPNSSNSKPKSSIVLSTHLRQRGLPYWTSYFVKYRDITSDQRGLSHFNWQVDGENYHILRTGCWPYIKYHCTKRPPENLQLENNLFRAIKVVNLGIPCLAYGVAASFLISCEELIVTPDGTKLLYYCPGNLPSIMKQQYILKTAPEVWKCLKGICCLYKPPRLSLHRVIKFIRFNLTQELNQMKYFSSDDQNHQEVIGMMFKNFGTKTSLRQLYMNGAFSNQEKSPGSCAPKVQSSKKFPDYTYHPLVLGDLYRAEDFSLSFVQKSPWFMSGICVMGIGEESRPAVESLRKAQLLSTYTLEGKLGVATRDFYYTGAPVERTPFDRVTLARMERALHKVQSHHQRKLVNQLGLPPNSQAAYEVLSKGLTRPFTTLEPVIHGIKVTEFARPHFCLEVTGVNLDGQYLLNLINDLGLMVRSSAHALQVRCIRQGPFTLDVSLLQKQWLVEPIISNINECKPLVTKLEHEHANLVSLEDFQEEQRHAYDQKLLEGNKLLNQEQESVKLLENNHTDETNVQQNEKSW